MKRENVHVDVEDGVLTISTQIDEKDERTEKGKYIYRERRYGRSSRSFIWTASRRTASRPSSRTAC